MHCSRAVLAGLILSAAVLGATAGEAAAATNPYSAQQLCGSEFKPFKQAPVGNFERTVRVGTVHVLRSKRKADRFCAVTLKRRWLDRPTYTSVSVTSAKQQARPFEYYAGPLKWTVNEPGDETSPRGCSLVFAGMRNPRTQETYFAPIIKFNRRGGPAPNCMRG